jgi:hypothetical protein
MESAVFDSIGIDISQGYNFVSLADFEVCFCFPVSHD